MLGPFLLFQIGRLFCGEGAVIPNHSHVDWFELTVITQGKGIVRTNGTEVPVRSGDVYLSFPCDFHGIVSDSLDPLKFDFFAFGIDPSHKAWNDELDQIVRLCMPADRRTVRDDDIPLLVSRALSEIEREDPYSDAMIEAIFTQILLHLIRLFSGHSQRPSLRSAEESDATSLCYSLMTYIDAHIYTLKGLDELSDFSNYNYCYLSSLFRKTTGSTLSDYYCTRRLETARLLILENKRSITNIAELLNYSSIYTFSRAFKDRYGLSPEHYRMQHLNG